MGIHCNNWDSYSPEPLTDTATGQSIGILMPRITLDILRASVGITSHSIPEFDERDK